MFRQLVAKLKSDPNPQPSSYVHPPARRAQEALPEIPRFPTKLPGSFWGIVTYFNPAGYQNKHSHLQRFSEGVRAQGLKLMIVELAFEGQEFVIRDDLADVVIRRRSKSVLFFKENLVNVGVAELPADCDKFAWLDADILFENTNWVQETSDRLEQYQIVQPFSEACWLHPGFSWAPPDYFTFGSQEGQSMHGMGAGLATTPLQDRAEVLSSFSKHGHTGFAWSARRALFTKHRFYEYQILGHNDVVISQAMFGNSEYWKSARSYAGGMPVTLSDHQTRWSQNFFKTVQGSVSFTPGRVFHLWHGAMKNRYYGDRFKMLAEYGFNPETDLILDAQGCLAWNTDKIELVRKVESYFRARKEEG